MIAKIKLREQVSNTLPAGSVHTALVATVGQNAQVADLDGVFWYVGATQFEIVSVYDLARLDALDTPIDAEIVREPKIHDVVGGKPKRITIEFFESH